MQLQQRDNGDGGFLTGNGQQSVVQSQFLLTQLQHPLLACQAEVTYGSLLGDAPQIVLMLLACSLQPLVFHPFLPEEGIIAQQVMVIAYQYWTSHELARVA